MEFFSDASLRRLFKPKQVECDADTQAAAIRLVASAHGNNLLTLTYIMPFVCRALTVDPSRLTRFMGSGLTLRTSSAVSLAAAAYSAHKAKSVYAAAGFNESIARKAGAANLLTTAFFSGGVASAISYIGARCINSLFSFRVSKGLPASSIGPLATTLAAAVITAGAFSIVYRNNETAANVRSSLVAFAIDKAETAHPNSAFAPEHYAEAKANTGEYLPAFPNQMLLEAAPRFPLPPAAGSVTVPFYRDVKTDLAGKHTDFYTREGGANMRTFGRWAEWAYATPAEAKHDARLGLADAPGPVTKDNAKELAQSATDIVKKFYGVSL